MLNVNRERERKTDRERERDICQMTSETGFSCGVEPQMSFDM